MNRFLLTMAAAMGFAAAGYAQEAEYLPQWSEGCLDIHTVAIDKGDATLIIMPDGTSMLIDAGDNDRWGWQDSTYAIKPGEKLARYIKHTIAPTPNPDAIDYVMITHFHLDHIGNGRDALPGNRGYRLSGITLVGEYLRFGKLVDRNWPDYDFPSKELVMKSNKSFMSDYLAFVRDLPCRGTEVEKFRIGSDRQFALKNDPGKYSRTFKIRNLASNGDVWTGRGLKFEKMYSGDPTLFDENMLSCAIKLSYGKFAYYNGGDISGGWFTDECKERNFETPVAKVCGKVTAMKADHHGWYDSGNGFFMQTLSPQVIIISASEKKHPVASTLTRLTDPLVWEGDRNFYITGEFARKNLGEQLWNNFKPSGHVVIRVYPGGGSYQVFVLDQYSGDCRIKYKSPVVTL